MARHWKWSFWRRAFVNDQDSRTIRSSYYSWGRVRNWEYRNGERLALIDSEDTDNGIVVWPERTREWTTPGKTIPMTADERAEIVDDLRSAIGKTKLIVSNEDPAIEIKSDAGPVRITIHTAIPDAESPIERKKYYRVKIGDHFLDKDGNRVSEINPASYIPEEDFDIHSFM